MYSNSLRQLGFWSAVLTAACSLLFSISGILALLKIISYPVDPIVPDIASLILAVAFMIMMVSIHYAAPQDRKHWSHMGVVLATLYAALVSIVYFVTVTVVVLLTLRGEADKIALFVFDQSGSFMQALDGLGYFFMSLATWFAAPVFPGKGLSNGSGGHLSSMEFGNFYPAGLYAAGYSPTVFFRVLWLWLLLDIIRSGIGNTGRRVFPPKLYKRADILPCFRDQ